MILQLSLAKKASLKLWISLKSRPPCSLGLLSFFHAIHTIFLLSIRSSHKKRVSTDWILWHRDIGAWERTADMTLLSIVIFHVVDKNLFDQPLAFYRMWSTIEDKRSHFDLPKCSGNPRYLPVPPSFWINSVSCTTLFCDLGVLRENVIEDLSVLIDCPEAVSYRLRIRFSAALHSLLARTKNIGSSA